jgi:hypothetical protein
MNTALGISFALAKKVPDIRQSGARIETSYGEIDLTPEESEAIAVAVEAALTKRLDALLGRQLGHLLESQLGMTAAAGDQA